MIPPPLLLGNSEQLISFFHGIDIMDVYDTSQERDEITQLGAALEW
jgi:hypothetical protein